MGIQFEWQAGRDDGQWETIAESQRGPIRRLMRRLPWWAWLLVGLVVGLSYISGRIWGAAGEVTGSQHVLELDDTRLLLDCVRAVKADTKHMLTTCRLNVYDGFAWPDGWGVSEDGGAEPDMTEPVRLVEDLYAAGVPMVNMKPQERS